MPNVGPQHQNSNGATLSVARITRCSPDAVLPAHTITRKPLAQSAADHQSANQDRHTISLATPSMQSSGSFKVSPRAVSALVFRCLLLRQYPFDQRLDICLRDFPFVRWHGDRSPNSGTAIGDLLHQFGNGGRIILVLLGHVLV